MNVGTTPISIGTGLALVQNLGTDPVYIGQSIDEVPVSDTNGFRINAGEAVSVGYAGGPVYVVSTGTSDVRVLNSGTGFYSPASSV